MPGIVLGAGYVAQDKTERAPTFLELMYCYLI